MHGVSFNAITRTTPGASLLHSPLAAASTLPVLALSLFLSFILVVAAAATLTQPPPTTSSPTNLLWLVLYLYLFFTLPRSPPPSPTLASLLHSYSPAFAALSSPRRLPRRARHSALFSFYRQQSWLMQYPPSSGNPFFILRLNILSRYRAVETSRLEAGQGGRTGGETRKRERERARRGRERERDGTPRNPRWRSTLLPRDKDPLAPAFDRSRRAASSSEIRGDSRARYSTRRARSRSFASPRMREGDPIEEVPSTIESSLVQRRFLYAA